MNTTGRTLIYLDQKQCAWFEVPYFGDASTLIAADAILRSRGVEGYDQYHKDILVPLGGRTLRLVRKEDGDEYTGPGWFEIKEAR